MTFDPRGNTPGLSPKAQIDPDKVINMKCRNPKCDSIQAVEIKIAGSEGQRVYRCIECGMTMPINVGGGVNF
jgi:hypothetical protein